MFLSYDVRGIQKFIFAVPNLRCVIGASSLIADFDQKVSEQYGAEVVYAGGGSGVIEIDATDKDTAKKFLLDNAKEIGVDLRIGWGDTLSEAKTADVLYAFTPENLTGEPCSMSGIFPVEPGKGWGPNKDVHPLVGMRREASNTDSLGEDLLNEISEKVRAELPDLRGFSLSFFRNVNTAATRKKRENYASFDHYVDQLDDAEAGSNALGNRNRWAVIAMDGNDAGQQHMKAQQLVSNGDWTPEFRREWIQKMSQTLVDATNEAFKQATSRVVVDWLSSMSEKQIATCCVREGESERLVLPLRPLIIGGDDVILLCHHEHAFTFVREMATAFERLCFEAADAWKEKGVLWPASGNQLTMSGGILFTKNSYPLHSAIQYSENLLGSAKGKHRVAQDVPHPTPAAVDWDIVTDSLLDTPAARRRRELTFFDKDINHEIVLTQRPYLLGSHLEKTESEFDQLERFADKLQGASDSGHKEIPNSLRASLLLVMQRPWAQRVQFFNSLSRKYPSLANWMGEENLAEVGEGWMVEKSAAPLRRSTCLLDALLILEERRRTKQETVKT